MTSNAQQPASLSKRAAAIKRKVDSFSPSAHISVVPFNGNEKFGTLVSSGQDSFTFYDVDQKTNISMTFGDVRKVKSGYGGYNSIQKRHTDRTKGILVTTIIVAGVVGGLLIALVSAKN